MKKQIFAAAMLSATMLFAAQDPATGGAVKGAVLSTYKAPLVQSSSSGTVNFDDVYAPNYTFISDYSGITWDYNIPDFWGNSEGKWAIWADASYGTAYSAPNYVFNAFGAINPGFTFSSAVDFNGAYLMKVQVSPAEAGVRFIGFRDGIKVDSTDWLFLTPTPTYLAANFKNVNRIVVDQNYKGWFAMDDMSYGEADVAATLRITPPNGNYLSTQEFDVGAGVFPTKAEIVRISGSVNGVDVSDILKECVIRGNLTDGGKSIRCPHGSFPALAPGHYTFKLKLGLSNGQVAEDSVLWKVWDTVE